MVEQVETPVLFDIVKIAIDESYYPRHKIDWDVVKQYTESMTSGAKFPPLILEIESNKLLDGVHRYHAAKKVPLSQMGVLFRTVPKEMTPKYYAAVLNSHTKHGHLLVEGEMKKVIREHVQGIGDFEMIGTVTRIAKDFGIPTSTVSEWIKDIYSSKKWSAQTKIMKLKQLGFTQSEIETITSVPQQTISGYLKQVPDLVPLLAR